MKELSMLLDELGECIKALTSVSEGLTTMFSGVQEQPEKESTPTVTIEDVRSVLAEKLRNGHGAEVKALIVKHGADTLSAVDPSEYAALLKEAEVVGSA